MDHYQELGSDYDDAIAELSDMRQAMRTPSRDTTGVGLLYEYYNQLYYFERRFFSPERGLGIYFEWYRRQCFFYLSILLDSDLI